MSETFSVRLPDDIGFTAKDIDDKAAQLGVNRSQLILNAIQMMMGFDPLLIQKAEQYSSAFKIPAWLVMQNMMLKRFGQDAARRELAVKPQPLSEFMFTVDGVVTGQQLFDHIKSAEVFKIERKRNQKSRTADAPLTLNGDESWLDEEDEE